MKSVRENNRIKKHLLSLAVSTFLLLISFYATAQDGNAGINEANTKVRSYFASGTNLMYAVGAIVGLIGAVKVYQKWNSGDHDTGKVGCMLRSFCFQVSHIYISILQCLYYHYFHPRHNC